MVGASRVAWGQFITAGAMLERWAAWTWSLAFAHEPAAWAGLRWEERLTVSAIFEDEIDTAEVEGALARVQARAMAARLGSGAPGTGGGGGSMPCSRGPRPPAWADAHVLPGYI